MDTCYYTFVKLTECTASRVNPNVNYRLWVIINYNKCTTLAIDDRGGRACAGMGDIRILCTSGSIFLCT